jgi:hypothetical protein
MKLYTSLLLGNSSQMAWKNKKKSKETQRRSLSFGEGEGG